MKKKKIVIYGIVISVITTITLIAVWGNTRMKRAEAIQRAIANPEYIKPEELLNKIDDSFMNLPEAEKKRLMTDPAVAEKMISDATEKELKKSFKLLFLLPSSMRKKVIKKSADDLRAKALKDPEKVSEFFNSPAGRGSLRGASKFFLMDLSGKQKADSAPLTHAMYEIVQREAYRRRQK